MDMVVINFVAAAFIERTSEIMVSSNLMYNIFQRNKAYNKQSKKYLSFYLSLVWP